MISDLTKWTRRERPSAARFHGKYAYIKWLPFDKVTDDVRKLLEVFVALRHSVYRCCLQKAPVSENAIVYAVAGCPNGAPEGLVVYHSTDAEFGVTTVSDQTQPKLKLLNVQLGLVDVPSFRRVVPCQFFLSRERQKRPVQARHCVEYSEGVSVWRDLEAGRNVLPLKKTKIIISQF